MKIEKVKVGDIVIMKTEEEMRKSKHSRPKIGESRIDFVEGDSYVESVDSGYCGTLITVAGVCKKNKNIIYLRDNGLKALLSVHAFKKNKSKGESKND